MLLNSFDRRLFPISVSLLSIANLPSLPPGAKEGHQLLPLSQALLLCLSPLPLPLLLLLCSLPTELSTLPPKLPTHPFWTEQPPEAEFFWPRHKTLQWKLFYLSRSSTIDNVAVGTPLNLSLVNSLTSFSTSSSLLSPADCCCCIEVRTSRQSFAEFVASIFRISEPGNTLLSGDLAPVAKVERRSEERRISLILEWRQVLRRLIDILPPAPPAAGSSRDPSKALSSQSLSQHNLSTGIKPASKVWASDKEADLMLRLGNLLKVRCKIWKGSFKKTQYKTVAGITLLIKNCETHSSCADRSLTAQKVTLSLTHARTHTHLLIHSLTNSLTEWLSGMGYTLGMVSTLL